MSPPQLPDSVLMLLRDRLKNFEQLEVLLLLRARVAEWLTSAQANAAIRLDPELISAALQELASAGLLESEGSNYRYRPATAALASAVDELASEYRDRHAAVMSQMSVNAIERIRSGSLKAFADSFVLNKRKDDG
jgi:DNA-binding IclR family transcriptional regulator